MDAALIAKDALEKGRGKVWRAKKCLILGEEELRRQEKTVTFRRAVQAALEMRQNRRPRTLIDFRYFTKRLMRICPKLADRRVRSIRPEECSAWLNEAFESLHQRRKARAILSGVFSTAIRKGWCDSNPIARVEAPQKQEAHIPILKPAEISNLLHTSQTHRNGSCAAAVGMMLYAGIRPNEIARLDWAQVDLKEKAIYIHPLHSKTGGARRVTIHKPLMKILRAHKRADNEKICPRNWQTRWRELRGAAGWNKDKRWHQDALRHTFASYHLSYFRSFSELQLEMGHRDASLLRTRYVDQRGVHAPARFWSVA